MIVNWRRSTLPFVGCLVILLLQEYHYLNFTLDDPFISFRYAENLASGHGLVFNPGEPVEGYTNFLWTVLLAFPALCGVSRFDLGLLLTAKALGVVFGIATMILLWRSSQLLQSARGTSELQFAWAGPLFLASTGIYAFWSMGALETPLVTFLVVLATVLYVRDELSGSSRLRVPLSSICFALASLTRPEPVLVFLAVALFRLIDRVRSHDLRRMWRYDALWFCTFSLILASFELWRYAYYGTLLPNTYYAKVAGITGELSTYSNGLQYFGSFVQSLRLQFLLPIFALPFAYRRWSVKTPALVLTIVVVQIASTVYAGGDWMPGFRFLVPSLPLLALLFQEGVTLAWLLVRDGAVRLGCNRMRPEAIAWGITSSLLLLASASSLHGAHAVIKGQLPWLVSGFQTQHLLPGEYYEVGKWMRANIPRDSLVALGEAGIIPYYSGVRVLDMFGLMDKHIARLPGPIHVKFDADYVLSRQPDYILLAGVKREQDGKLASPYVYANVLWREARFRDAYQAFWQSSSGYFVLYRRVGG